MKDLIKKIKFRLLYNKYKNIPRFTPCTIRYKKYLFETPDSLSVLGQIKEIFFDEIYFFIPSDKENIIIYDCGANAGLASIYLKKLYPGAIITAFEADPAIAKYLEKNIIKNKAEGINIVAKAVWIKNGFINFSSEGADGGSISDNKNELSVACIRLKDRIENETKIDFLKLDIEGAELEVLKDCKDVLHKATFIFVEYHSYKNQPQQLHELLEILSSCNFRYHIEGLSKKKKPFCIEEIPGNFDLQLNIFAVNQKKPQN